MVTDEASLRAAIEAANLNGSGSITINATGTINLTSPLPVIVSDLEIIGPGAAQLTISGENAFRVFHIGDGFTTPIVVVQGLTIANGAAIGGAANRAIGRIGLGIGDRMSFGYRVESGSGAFRHTLDFGMRFD